MQQLEKNNSFEIPDDPAFSVNSQIRKVWELIRYILKFWRLLMLFAVIGSLAGAGYAWTKPVMYTARTNFVVEESKTGGGSIMSALAGQMGFDLGGLSGASGVLAGDNVLELLKSETLIRKTLLTPFTSNTNISLADVYADSYDLKTKWKKSSKVGVDISFPVSSLHFNRTTDSLLQKIIQQIKEEELSVSKPDKKLGFFELQVSFKNEALCVLFCKRLLNTTIDFYIDTKTRRLSNNVSRLQKKADSLEATLNRKTYSASDANKMLLDINPAYNNPGVSAEITTREKFMQGTIYSEIVKNLEMSKTALIQETPTIQIVDEPIVPLKSNKLKYWLAMFSGSIFAMLLTALFLVAKKND